MNILLLNYAPRAYSIRFPLGLGMISAAFDAAGISYDVADLTFESDRDLAMEQALTSKSYDLIGLSSIIGNGGMGFVEELSSKIKVLTPDATLVLGGAFPSSTPEMILRHTAADILVVGEGEETVIELLRQLEISGDLSKVKGIAYTKNGNIVLTPARPRIKDLDQLPPVSYERFPIDKYIDYLDKTGRCFELTGSRGCYGKCNFCFKTFGRAISTKSLDKIVTEMISIEEKYGINRFNFTDDNFFNSKRRVLDFCQLVKGLSIEYRFQCRVDFIDEPTAKLMTKSGVKSLNFGIESPVNNLLDSISKQSNPRQQADAIHICQDAGIEVYTSFIIGIPGENRASLQATYDFIIENNIEAYSQINFLTPLPGTRLYADCIKRGYIQDEYAYVCKLDDLYNQLHINLTDLPDSELIAFKNKQCNFQRKRNVHHKDFEQFLLEDK